MHKVDWDKFSGSDPSSDDDAVWGIAYTIDPAYVAEVRDYLDYREKDGYTVEVLDIYGMDGDQEKVIIHDAFCYVGRDDNPSYVGYEPIDALAKRIWSSVGPSGRNKDYLYDLVTAVRELCPSSFDSYLHTLEEAVRALDAQYGI